MLSCSEDEDEDKNYFKNTHYNCIPIWEREKQQQQQCDKHHLMDEVNNSINTNDSPSMVQHDADTEKLDEKNNDWHSMSFSFKKNTGESGGSDNTYGNKNENHTNNDSHKTKLQLHFPDNCLLYFNHFETGIILYTGDIKIKSITF